MSHTKEIVNGATVVLSVAESLQEMLCDHQAFFVLILDEHLGAMPAAEDVMKRPPEERQRAADVLRMWAARIEQGAVPQRGDS